MAEGLNFLNLTNAIVICSDYLLLYKYIVTISHAKKQAECNSSTAELKPSATRETGEDDVNGYFGERTCLSS